MKLEHIQQTISEQETLIQAVVFDGVNQWRNEHDQKPIHSLPAYAPPLIRYAIEDWVDEYNRGKDHRPDTPFDEYIKEQENNVMFHFKQSLTHKAETAYRDAHAVLWRVLNQDEQDALIFGLRQLIHKTN